MPNTPTPNHPLTGTRQVFLPPGKTAHPDANTPPAHSSTVARYGDTVIVLDVYENWNDVPGLTVAYVYVPSTRYRTHVSLREIGQGVPALDGVPGDVCEGDLARHVESGQLATIRRVWESCGDRCVTVQNIGRSHLDNGGAVTCWVRVSADGGSAAPAGQPSGGPGRAAGITLAQLTPPAGDPGAAPEHGLCAELEAVCGAEGAQQPTAAQVAYARATDARCARCGRAAHRASGYRGAWPGHDYAYPEMPAAWWYWSEVYADGLGWAGNYGHRQDLGAARSLARAILRDHPKVAQVRIGIAWESPAQGTSTTQEYAGTGPPIETITRQGSVPAVMPRTAGMPAP